MQIERWREPPREVLHEIRLLLFASFGKRLSEDDWRHCLGGDHLLGTESDRIVTHAAVVPRRLLVGEEWMRAGYVEGVATAPERQGKGLGSALMQSVNAMLDEEFQLGALSTARHSFYERSGWQRWQGPTFVLESKTPRRTADEDSGILVRVPPRADVDLTLPLTCEARSGDDW